MNLDNVLTENISVKFEEVQETKSEKKIRKEENQRKIKMNNMFKKLVLFGLIFVLFACDKNQVFDEYRQWVADTMTTEPQPYIRVLAALTR